MVLGSLSLCNELIIKSQPLMKLDILAFAVHPDDAELSCSGTLIKHIKAGKKVGVIDLTAGELGTRGSGPLRLQEAAVSAKILGLSARENLGMADGFFEYNRENQLAIIRMIRKYQPEIVLANALDDRHPDHGKAAKLTKDACFLAGLIKVKTEIEGKTQTHWRPKQVFHYIQDRHLIPDFVVDITDEMDQKMEAIMAFKSQFFDPNNSEPTSPISSKEFLESVKGKNSVFGRELGVAYAEGFNTDKIIGVEDLFDLR